MSELQKIESFRRDLAIAETIEEIKALESEWAAMTEFARKQKMVKSKQDDLGEVGLEIEAKKGAWLDEFYPNGGDRGNQYKEAESETRTLAEIDISKNESARARRIARYKIEKQEEFNSILDEIKQSENIVSPYVIERELRRKENGAHVSNNSGNDEWYTPPEIIEAARRVMGSIDLDPASCQPANRIVRATRFFDEIDDGLKDDNKWQGNIWMNPPYSQPLIDEFIEKLSKEAFSQAIVLTNNATETRWGNKILTGCHAICFPKGRIRFVDRNGSPGKAPLQGQMIAYFGDNTEAFNYEFSTFGVCLSKP